MPRIKLKECALDGCSNEFKQYKSTDKFCSYACFNESKKSDSSPAKKKKKKIKPVSDKRLKELAIYRPLRDQYLKDNPICEVKGCNNPTTNLHHKKGRIGKLVHDVRYFMACCHICHPEKIHENPEWARENGYLL